MITALKGNYNISKLLLHNGGDPNVYNPATTKTPLLHAVISGNLPLAELLLRFNANPDLPDETGWSPLRWAEYKKDVQMTQLIKNYGGKDLLPKWVI